MGNFIASSGVLELTGTASLADYQAAALAITYENISENPSVASRLLEETVYDGDITSNAITVVHCLFQQTACH